MICSIGLRRVYWCKTPTKNRFSYTGTERSHLISVRSRSDLTLKLASGLLSKNTGVLGNTEDSGRFVCMICVV